MSETPTLKLLELLGNAVYKSDFARAERAKELTAMLHDRIRTLERERDKAIEELGKWSRKAGRLEAQLADREERLEKLSEAVNEAPRNKTDMPPEFQRLWESCVRLSSKAEFKHVFRHLERLEAKLKDREERLERVLGLTDELALEMQKDERIQRLTKSEEERGLYAGKWQVKGRVVSRLRSVVEREGRAK